MLTMKIGETELRAENLKELNKLAKVEMKRQAKFEEERKAKLLLAEKRAWESYGKIAYRLNNNVDMWFLDGEKVEKLKVAIENYEVKVEQEETGYFRLGTDHKVNTVLMEGNGNFLAIKTYSTRFDEQIWLALGVHDGVVETHYLDSDLSTKLEEKYQKWLAQAEQAA